MNMKRTNTKNHYLLEKELGMNSLPAIALGFMGQIECLVRGNDEVHETFIIHH